MTLASSDLASALDGNGSTHGGGASGFEVGRRGAFGAFGNGDDLADLCACGGGIELSPAARIGDGILARCIAQCLGGAYLERDAIHLVGA